MSATRFHGPRLETPATPDRFREQIVVRSRQLADRLMGRDRLDAFVALFANAPRKPDALNELTRAEPRLKGLYDERHRALIHEGIKAGYITREQVIRYRASQVRDDLAAFPDARQADDTLFCALMSEAGEMVEAQVNARGMPTRENVAHAVKQTDELISVAQLLAESQRVSA